MKYEIDVSQEGVITNLSTGRIIAQRKNIRGDLQVDISGMTRMVKELVAGKYLGFKKNGKRVLVYHIDGDKSNCRADNLTIDSNRCTGTYKGKDMFDTSKYRGVSWDLKKNKFRAILTHKGTRYDLRYYDTEELAHEALEKKRKKLGIFAL